MSPDIRFACAVFLLDLISVWILRDTLNDFLTGNCSKTGVRNIRRTLSAGNRVTLGYIEPYIREEKEKLARYEQMMAQVKERLSQLGS